jgi:membrane-associated phospholipid phosphatase
VWVTAGAAPAKTPGPELAPEGSGLHARLDLPASLRLAGSAYSVLDGAVEGASHARPENAAAADGWLSRTAEGTLACLRQFWRRCPISQERAVPRGRSVLTLTALVAAVVSLELAVDPAVEPRWTGGGSVDRSARDALRGGSRRVRDNSSAASDAVFAALGVGLIVDWWWLRDEYPLANSVLTDASWFFSDLVATQAFKLATARERPLVQPCGVDPRYSSACGFSGQFNLSFISGHASSSATFAGLLCNRHLTRAGRSGWDVAICGVAAAGSLATGLLRVSGDRHWTSDVVAGWAVGALFGGLLPYLVDYRRPHPAPAGRQSLLQRSSLEPLGEPGAYGLRYTLQF